MAILWCRQFKKKSVLPPAQDNSNAPDNIIQFALLESTHNIKYLYHDICEIFLRYRMLLLQ